MIDHKPGYRKTGHWLTDAMYSLPREHGTNITSLSEAVFKKRSRGSEIARHYGKALADMDAFFAALGYEIELVKMDGGK